MKTLILLLALIGSVAGATRLEHTPRIDRIFLNVHSGREAMISAIEENLKVFCQKIENLNETEQRNANAAIESCQLPDLVKGLDESEQELGLKNGEPFMVRVQIGPFNEAAVWRYFVRTQKVRRLMSSLTTYFSQSAAANKGKVGLVSIPKLAGSLDQYSYWTRLLAMQDNSFCPDKNLAYCKDLEAQLPSVVMLSLSEFKGLQKKITLNDQNNHLIALAKVIRKRLSKMTLIELDRLEKMEDVTSAGLGITYFRQFLDRMNLQNQKMTLMDQKKLQSILILLEIQEAISRWEFPVTPVEVDKEAVHLLSKELNSLIELSGVTL